MLKDRLALCDWLVLKDPLIGLLGLSETYSAPLELARALLVPPWAKDSLLVTLRVFCPSIFTSVGAPKLGS